MTVEEIAAALGASVLTEAETFGLDNRRQVSWWNCWNATHGIIRPDILPDISEAEANARKRIAEVQQGIRRFSAMDCERESSRRAAPRSHPTERIPMNTVTVIGNLTTDPELRFTPSGHAVANFTVAVNRRTKNGDQWEDKLEGFFGCTCWREMAENVAETLTKGSRVIVAGRLEQKQWEDNEGNKRSAVEIQVDEVGPSLRWASATISKISKTERGDAA